MAESKALELMALAEKKVRAFSFFSNSSKEEAVELFDKASAQFKISKQFKGAGEAYLRAAEVSSYLKNELEACNYYTQAAKAFKNVSSSDAVRAYRICVQMHMENNRFSTAAKMYQAIAELEEKENHIRTSIEAYEKAAECFFAEDSSTSGNQMLLKIAHFAAQQEDYKKAIEIFDKVSLASLDTKLLSYSVKDYMFKASLCHFAMASKTGDVSSVTAAVDKYKDLHPAFEPTRECKLIENCVQAFQEDDVNKFTDFLFNYDKIYRLDSWTSSLLLTIKRALQNEPHQLGPSATQGSGVDLQSNSASSSYASHASRTNNEPNLS